MLSGKHTANDGHVTVLVSTPFDLGRILSWELFSLQLLCIGERPERCFVPGHIQIFVHVVENKFQELFGILLLVNPPLRVEVTAYSLSIVSIRPME